MKKLSESVWADIHRRSNGKQERIENGVNQLDLEGLYRYLDKIYYSSEPESMIEIHRNKDDKWLTVCIFEDTAGYIFSICYDGINIWLPYDMVSDFIDIDEVNMLFSTKLEKNGFDIYLISFSSKKNGDVNNSLLIEVIDYILSKVPDKFNKLIYKKTNESVWADIHRRSNGEQTRKEDDVDLLDSEGFVQYLKEHYHIKDGRSIYVIKESEKIVVPIIKIYTSTCFIITYDVIKRSISFSDQILKRHNDLYQKLIHQFWIENATDGYSYLVYDDNHKVSNKLFLEVIDFIIDNTNTEKLIIEKI